MKEAQYELLLRQIDATRKADEKKKEMILEAKEEVLRQKSELDKEINARRADIQRSERRCQQREETLDKKLDALDQREKTGDGTGTDRKHDPGRGPADHRGKSPEGSLP